VSAYVLGFAVGPLVLAPLTEFFGRRPLYIGGNALKALGNIGCALAPSIWWLVAFRFTAGCAGASPITLGSGTVSDLMKKEQRGRALSVIAFSSVCGPVVGPMLGGAIAQNVGWRACFLFLFIVVSGLGMPAGLLLAETLTHS